MPYEGRPIIPNTKPIPGKSAFGRLKKSISSSAANTPNHNLISGLAALGIAASSGLVASIRQAQYNRKYNISPDNKSEVYIQGERLLDENENLISDAIDEDNKESAAKTEGPEDGMQSSMGMGGKRKSKKKRPTKRRRPTKKRRRPTKRSQTKRRRRPTKRSQTKRRR
tara:strand:- start:30 stop:533 length:504 start_codon:yes stop_codon:yes gene_type:complete